MKQLTLIWGFGLIGITTRFFTDRFCAGHFDPKLPISTFSINVLGSFLIGVVYVFGAERGMIAREFQLALNVGLLGGFTTFSAYSIQTLQLAQSGMLFPALAYFTLSPIAGIIAAYLGMTLARGIL